MFRLAPSAVNKQPWRVVVTDNAVHFFEKHSMPAEGADLQRIDDRHSSRHDLHYFMDKRVRL